MENRLIKLRNIMTKNNAQAILLESKAMKRYLKTLTGGGCAVLVTLDDAYLLYDGRYDVEAKTREKSLKCRLIERGKQSLYQEVALLAAGTVLVEASVTYQEYLQMQNAGLRVQICSDDLLLLRSQKGYDDFNTIKDVVRITDSIFERILSHVHVGMTEKELCAFVYYESFLAGADAMSFEPIVTSGIRTALPHGRASDKVIEANEPIMIDFGIEMRGVQSDMTRMVSIGEVSVEMNDIYHVVLDAQNAAIAAVKTGEMARDIDKASRDVIENAGYGSYYVHGLGHGVGVDNSNEWPLMNQSSKTRLENGMVFTCEPGIYIPNVGGVRIEDIVGLYNDETINFTTSFKSGFIVVEDTNA